MSVKFIKELVENAVTVFVAAWFGASTAAGLSYESLTDSANLKVGVVALAVSVAAGLGLKKVGPNKDSASIL